MYRITWLEAVAPGAIPIGLRARGVDGTKEELSNDWESLLEDLAVRFDPDGVRRSLEREIKSVYVSES
jgi:hypothetical protein